MNYNYACEVEDSEDNNTQPERGSRYEMEMGLQKKRLPAPDKNHKGSPPWYRALRGTLVQNGLTVQPFRHCAGHCRPAHHNKSSIQIILLLSVCFDDLLLLLLPSMHALAEASTALVLQIPFPGHTVASCSTPNRRHAISILGAPRPRRMASRLPLSISPTADRLIRPHAQTSAPFRVAGCPSRGALHTERSHHTPQQEHRRPGRTGSEGASFCPCAEITTRGQCIGYWIWSYLCCRPRPDSRPHTHTHTHRTPQTARHAPYIATQNAPASAVILYRNH